MANTPFQQSLPQLAVKEIQDIYTRKNFQALQDYFLTQNQLMNFNFFDLVFTGAVSNFKQNHGFKYIPEDIIVTKTVGPGTVSFNNGLFDEKNIDLTVTGACRVRFFVGTYWNQIPKAKDTADAVTQFAANSTDLGITNIIEQITNITNQINIINNTIASGGSVAAESSLTVGGRTFTQAEMASMIYLYASIVTATRFSVFRKQTSTGTPAGYAVTAGKTMRVHAARAFMSASNTATGFALGTGTTDTGINDGTGPANKLYIAGQSAFYFTQPQLAVPDLGCAIDFNVASGLYLFAVTPASAGNMNIIAYCTES